MSGDILTVKTVKRVRSIRGSALVHITTYYLLSCFLSYILFYIELTAKELFVLFGNIRRSYITLSDIVV